MGRFTGVFDDDLSLPPIGGTRFSRYFEDPDLGLPPPPSLTRRAADAYTSLLNTVPGLRTGLEALGGPARKIDELVRPLGFESGAEAAGGMLLEPFPTLGTAAKGLGIDVGQPTLESERARETAVLERAAAEGHPDAARLIATGAAGVRRGAKVVGGVLADPTTYAFMGGPALIGKGATAVARGAYGGITKAMTAEAAMASVARARQAANVIKATEVATGPRVALGVFGPGMVEGALQGAAAAGESYDAAGKKLTPETAEHAAEAAASALMLASMGLGALRGAPPDFTRGTRLPQDPPPIDVDFTVPGRPELEAAPLRAEWVNRGRPDVPRAPGPVEPPIDVEPIVRPAIEGPLEPAGLLPAPPVGRPMPGIPESIDVITETIEKGLQRPPGPPRLGPRVPPPVQVPGVTGSPAALAAGQEAGAAIPPTPTRLRPPGRFAGVFDEPIGPPEPPASLETAMAAGRPVGEAPPDVGLPAVAPPRHLEGPGPAVELPAALPPRRFEGAPPPAVEAPMEALRRPPGPTALRVPEVAARPPRLFAEPPPEVELPPPTDEGTALARARLELEAPPATIPPAVPAEPIPSPEVEPAPPAVAAAPAPERAPARPVTRGRPERIEELQATVPVRADAVQPTSREAEFVQPESNRVLAASEILGDAADAETVRVKGFDALDRKRQSVMLSQVSRALDDLEIRRRIVAAVPVDVMDGLVGKEWTAENLLNDKSVLSSRLTFSGDEPVPVTVRRFVDVVAAIAEPVTGPRAEPAPLGSSSRPVDLPSYGSPARTADHLDDRHVEIVPEPEPTPGQKLEGNYRKQHVKWGGLDITIENAKGQPREAADGSWRVEKMPAHYGYLKRTKGKDGDQVDVYMGPMPGAKRVFVIDQIGADSRKFDEHKAMLGFPSQRAALAAYDAGFSDGRGPERRGAVTTMSVQEFRTWLDSGKTKQALKYKEALDVGAEKAETQVGASDVAVAGVGGAEAAAAEPSGEPARADQGALEGAPAEEVPEPRAKRPTRERDRGGVPEDEGSVLGEPVRRPEPEPSVGAGEGAVGLPASGERSGVVGDEAAKPELEAALEPIQKTKLQDFRIRPEDDIGVGSVGTKIKQNLEAIELVRKIEAEGRAATPEEQAVLGKYVGWGAFPQLFTSEAWQQEWRDRRASLEKVLEPGTPEHTAARASTINAHYTSPEVVRAMWDAVQRLGVHKGTSILEPAMGVGNFFGLQPESLLPSPRTGVELDKITALLAKHLYPNAAVFQKEFQRAKLPEDHYGLVITNVPFANVSVHDPSLKEPEAKKSLHNYFLAKSISLLRPGGLLATITSHYTMDARDAAFRKYLAKHADLVGAIRLPDTAFKGNAGTEVVTDVLFLRKRAPGDPPAAESWAEAKPLTLKDKRGDDTEHHVNEWFLNHPEMVLGEHAAVGSMYAGAEYTLTGKLTPEMLREAVDRLPQDVVGEVPGEGPPQADVVRAQVESGDRVKQLAYAVKDGKLVVRRGEFYEPAGVSQTDEARIRGQIPIRDAVRGLLEAQLDPDTSDAQVAKLQRGLGAAYDSYVKKNGPLNARNNQKAFIEDPDSPLLLALENWDPDTKKATKAPIFSQRTIVAKRKIGKVANAVEALPIVLSETGGVDMRRLQQLTGKTRAKILTELGHLVYENPSGGKVEAADEYLSGNVREKLEQAKAAAAADSRYARNVKALELAQPEWLSPRQIAARLGSPWIPTDTIKDFLAELLQTDPGQFKVAHATEIGAWSVDAPTWLMRGERARDLWGTADSSTTELVEGALNLRDPVVRRTDSDGKSYTDQDATIANLEKQSQIQEEFKKWLWAESARADRLLDIYNTTQNNIRDREFDGSHLELPGMAKLALRSGDLEPHQKNGAWRIIQASAKVNALLNHVVGSGKTFTGIAAIMEMRRLGTVTKAIVATPKHLVSQWANEWLRLYPMANILKVDAKAMTPEYRERLMAKMATGNYDAILMSYESLSKLPVKPETYERFMQEQIAELESAIMQLRAESGGRRGSRGDSRVVKQLEKDKQRLEERIKNYLDEHSKDTGVPFEELGADLLFVDEAHAYKRLMAPSKLQIRGIAKGGSNRAMDLYMKSRHLNQRGGKIVFATGTPVTNTMGEAFVLQKFLQPELLKERGLEHFDSWAASFGETVLAAEMDVTGSFKPISRFSRFVNVPELASLLGQTMDTRLAEDLNLPTPEVETGSPMIHAAPASAWQEQYIKDLGVRSDRVRSRSVDPRSDNMLKITTDGRKAATDMRLIDPSIPDYPNSKMNLAAGKIADIFKSTRGRKATQVVFLDLGTPKDGTAASKVVAEDADPAAEAEAGTVDEDRMNESLYADLRKKIVAQGVPDGKIAFIHDAKTDAKKDALQRRMNSGELSVLIGSTAKMGTGLNIQKKLYALHLISPPMRPDQVEQAIGRIVRQGNEHRDLKIPVQIHFYATKATYDAVLYQMLQSKQRFVNDFMKAKAGVRTIEDTGTVELTYAQAKAIASGDPRIIEKVTTDALVAKLASLKATHDDVAFRRRQNLQRYKETVAWNARLEAESTKDLAKYEKAKKEAGEGFELTVGKKTYDDRAEAGTALINAAQEAKKLTPGETHVIGEHLGFPIGIRWFAADKGLANAFEIAGRNATLSDAPLGVVQSLTYTLKSIASEPERYKAQGARAARDVRDAEENLGKPFEREAELAEALKKQRELDQALKKKGEEAAGAAPPQEPPKPPGGGGETPFFDGEGALDRLRRGRSGKAYDLGGAAAAGAGVAYDVGVYAASVVERMARAAAGAIPKFGAWARQFANGVKGVVTGFYRMLRSLYDKAVRAFRSKQAETEAARPEPARARAGAGAPPRTPPPPRRGAAAPPPGGGPRASWESASIPLFVTRKMREELRAKGYSDLEIDRMKPEDAWHLLGPRVEQDVRRGTKAAKEADIPFEKLDRETARSWDDIEPEVREHMERSDDYFYNVMKRRQLDDAEIQAWTARVKGKEEILYDARADVAAAEARGNAQEILTSKSRFAAASMDYVAALRAMVNDGTGTARALAARAKLMQSIRDPSEAFLRRIFRDIEGVTDAQAADLVRVLNEDPLALAEALHAAINPGWLSKWLEFWKAGLVSGPGTQVANILGNIGEQTIRLGETGVASIVDTILGGADSPQRFTGEARAELAGAVSNLGPAIRRLTADIEAALRLRPEQIDVRKSLETQIGAIAGKKGRFVRIPFRLLDAFDNFFSVVGGHAELAKLAYRKAAQELGSGATRAQRLERAEAIRRETLNPESDRYIDLLRQVSKSKLERTFRNDPPRWAETIMYARNRHRWLHGVLPFVRTPANILDASIRRSPLGFARAAKAYQAYRRGEISRGAAADAIAAPLVGTAIMGFFYVLAKNNMMTGQGPTDEKKKRLLRDTGWQPYSFVIPLGGGKQTYVAFNRFEPVSSLLGFAADAAEASDSKQAGDFIDKGVGSIGQNLLSKSFLTGLADASAFVSRPREFASQYARNLAGSVVPTIVAKLGQAIDPTIRDTRPSESGLGGVPEAAGKAILARLPGAAQLLPARTSGTGEPIRRQGTALERFLSPVQRTVSSPKEQALERELIDVDYAPSSPSRTITLPRTGGKEMMLTSEEYRIFVEADRKMTQRLRRDIADPRYRRMTSEEKKRFLQNRYRLAAEDARRMVLPGVMRRSRLAPAES